MERELVFACVLQFFYMLTARYDDNPVVECCDLERGAVVLRIP